MPFAATVISCLPPKRYFFGTTLHNDLTPLSMQENFMFGKLDYWRIYFSLAGRVALSLQDSCWEGYSAPSLTPPPAPWLLQPLPRQEWLGWLRAAAAESSHMFPGR